MSGRRVLRELLQIAPDVGRVDLAVVARSRNLGVLLVHLLLVLTKGEHAESSPSPFWVHTRARG
jgi:hypothetical protein